MNIYCKGLLLILFFLFLTPSGPGQDARLITEAKKEGKVVAYGSLESDIFDDIQKSFTKKTGIVFGQKGAPLDYVRLEKMLGHGHYVALNNKAPHPNAGKALIDFFLGDESMRIMARMGEFVSRKGLYPPLPDADKIQVVEMDELDTAGFAEKRKEYRKLFFQ